MILKIEEMSIELETKAPKHWNSPTEPQTNANYFKGKYMQYLVNIGIIFHSIIKKETGSLLKHIYKAIHLYLFW